MKEVLKRIYSNTFVKMVIHIILLMSCISLFSSLTGGFMAYILAVIGWSLVVYLTRFKEINDRILFAIQSLESAIWGKPLDKEFWSDGEWKKRKQLRK